MSKTSGNGLRLETTTFNQAWPDPAYCKQIARSFSEFLEQVLRTRRGLYWLLDCACKNGSVEACRQWGRAPSASKVPRPKEPKTPQPRVDPAPPPVTDGDAADPDKDTLDRCAVYSESHELIGTLQRLVRESELHLEQEEQRREEAERKLAEALAELDLRKTRGYFSVVGTRTRFITGT